MSAIKQLLASLAKRLRSIGKNMTKEEAIAECERMRRLLEFKGQSLMKEAQSFHAKAAQYAKAGLVDLARAKLTSWAEYRHEAVAHIMLSDLLTRVKLRISRMKTIEEINAFGEMIGNFFDRTLQKLPDNPILAVRQLESSITAMDSMLGLQVETVPSIEHEELVEAELERLMKGEAAPELVPEGLPTAEEAAPAPEAGGELEGEARRKLEEIRRKLAEAGERA